MRSRARWNPWAMWPAWLALAAVAGLVGPRAVGGGEAGTPWPGLGHAPANIGHYAGTMQGNRTEMPSLGSVCSGGRNQLVEVSLAGSVFGSAGSAAGPGSIGMGTIAPTGLAETALAKSEQHWNGNLLRYSVPAGVGNGTFVEYRVNNLFPGLWARTGARTIEMLQGRPPSDIAFVVGASVKQVAVPEKLESVVAAPLAEMTENWFLCWFSGRPGWRDAKWWAHFSQGTGFDAPWLVVLQHRPQAARLSRKSLALSFVEDAGHVLAMPLYGIVYLEPGQTQKWRQQGLPEDVVRRCREWASRARQVPTRTSEELEILDGGRTVRIRVSCQFEEIHDEWKTPGRKCAPFWPLAGIVLRYNQFYKLPLEVAPALVDTGYETQYGPFYGVPGADTYEVTIRDTGRYLSEAVSGSPVRGETAERAAQEIRRRLRQTVSENRNIVAVLSSGDESSPLAVGTKAHQVRAAAETLYLLEGDEREAAARYLKRLVREYLLKAEYFQGNNFVGEVFAVRKDWGMTSTNGRLAYALWAYAQATGDWQTIADHWPLVRKAFRHFQEGSDWLLVFPQRHLAPVVLTHEDIAGVIGFGRMAHAVGDREMEAWSRYLLAKYLVAQVGVWKSMSYVCDCQRGNPRNYIYPELGPNAPQWVGQAHDAMSTKAEAWYPSSGPHFSGDSTLYDAPWRGLFFLAVPEEHRFLGAYLRDDLVDVVNLLKTMYPGVFLAPASHQYTNEWGVKGGYYLLLAYALRTAPAELRYMVPPDKAFIQDPLRLIHLKGLIDACAGLPWRDVLIGVEKTQVKAPGLP